MYRIVLGVYLILSAVCVSPIVYAGSGVSRVIDSTGDVGRFTSIALDDNGYPVIAYQDLTHRDLKLIRCADKHCADTEAMDIKVLVSEGLVGLYNSLQLDSQGRPVISFYDATVGTLKVLRCDQPVCDQFSIAVPDSTDDIVGSHSSLILDADDHPVISYYDASNGDLKFIRCDDPACRGDEAANILTLDSTGDVGLYSSVILNKQNLPVISYHSAEDGLKLLFCKNPVCQSDDAHIVNPLIVNPLEDASGWFGSVVLGESGNPIVSFYDIDSGDLRLLICDDHVCSGNESRNVAELDTEADVGAYNSLALNQQGNPVLSYHDSTNGKLKMAFCEDSACGSFRIDSVGTEGESGAVWGLFSSLVLDENGQPVVSFYDATNGDLRLLYCSGAACSR